MSFHRRSASTMRPASSVIASPQAWDVWRLSEPSSCWAVGCRRLLPLCSTSAEGPAVTRSPWPPWAIKYTSSTRCRCTSTRPPRRAQQPSPVASVAAGEARNLAFPDASADAVLLLGPLYHLTEAGDRLSALREARRVVRPRGAIVVAGISAGRPLLTAFSARSSARPSSHASSLTM
jgi:SAM-dependent methyltransferase